MRTPWRILLAITLAVGVGCGGSSGARPSASPPTAPTHFQTLNPSATTLDLTWEDASQPPPDGYEIQGRVDGGAFQPLHTGLLPPATRAAALAFSGAVPELTTCDFQIRSVKGSLSSAWAQASYQYPLLPPDNANAICLPDTPGVQVSWTEGSLIAEATMILRREAGAADGAWTVLGQVDRSVLNWTDSTAREGIAYEYGLQHEARGTILSLVSMAPRVVVPCLIPQNLRGAWNGASIELRWDPQSATATLQTVSRLSQTGVWTKLADLHGAASAYTDPAPPAGLNWYWIDVSSPSMFAPLQSPRALVVPPIMAGLLATPLAQGIPCDLTRQPDGVWWMAEGQTMGGGGDLQSFGAPRDAVFPLPPVQILGFHLDAANTLHWMGPYLNDASQRIGHVWKDASGLQIESLATVFPNGIQPRSECFLLAPDGSPEILAQEPYPDLAPSPLLRAVKGPGGWTRETLPSPWNPETIVGSALTPDGTLLVGMAGSGAAQSGVGWWKANGDSGLDPLPGNLGFRDILPTPWGETFLICFEVQQDGTRAFRFFRGQPGLWLGPDALPSEGGPALYGTWTVDGVNRRILGVGENAAGTESVLITCQGGSWTALPLGVKATRAWSGVGPNGKLWLALKLASAFQDTDPVLVLQEP